MGTQRVAEGGFRPRPGDRLVVRGHHVGEPERDGEILEVHGEDGLPSYLIRWSDDGHVSRLFPGSDAYVEQVGEPTKTQEGGR